MSQQSTRPPWQRHLHWLPSSALGAWFFARTLHHVDRPILRLTHGQRSLTSVIAGLPIVTLTTTGAKSGQPRTVPLVGIPDGDKIVLIASSYGRPRHPAWYHNLRSNPEARLEFAGRSGTYIAREVTGAERAEYWRRAVAIYRGFAAYERRTRGRIIPVLVLAPREP